MADQHPVLSVRDLSKTFVLHTQSGARLPVFDDLSMDVFAGECVALHGPSGSGKSTLLRALYANYKADTGHILLRHGETTVDMVSANPRAVLWARKHILGYVSQFLRVIPRVPTLDIVAEPLRALGTPLDDARDKAAGLLTRLRIPETMWQLAPATFSGGEQQRVNIARGFIVDYPALLLDEPTASLDARNSETVMDLIDEAKGRGTAIVGIFHDADVRERVANRLFQIQSYKEAA